MSQGKRTVRPRGSVLLCFEALPRGNGAGLSHPRASVFCFFCCAGAVAYWPKEPCESLVVTKKVRKTGAWNARFGFVPSSCSQAAAPSPRGSVAVSIGRSKCDCAGVSSGKANGSAEFVSRTKRQIHKTWHQIARAQTPAPIEIPPQWYSNRFSLS